MYDARICVEPIRTSGSYESGQYILAKYRSLQNVKYRAPERANNPGLQLPPRLSKEVRHFLFYPAKSKLPDVVNPSLALRIRCRVAQLVPAPFIEHGTTATS